MPRLRWFSRILEKKDVWDRLQEGDDRLQPDRGWRRMAQRLAHRYSTPSRRLLMAGSSSVRLRMRASTRITFISSGSATSGYMA